VSRYVAQEVGPSARLLLGGIGQGAPVVCASCHHENGQDARFCDSCGTAL
jgi:hypothetical protein